MNRLLTQVDDQRSPTSSVTMAYALDEWLRTSEVEDSTRDGYVNYIERYIRPVLGSLAVRRVDAHALESFYTELRRCRIRCDGKPFIEKHKTEDEHDCVEKKCEPHKCNPLAASTVRQIHSVISGTLPQLIVGVGSTRIPLVLPAGHDPNRRSPTRRHPQKQPSSRKRRSGWKTTGAFSYDS